MPKITHRDIYNEDVIMHAICATNNLLLRGKLGHFSLVATFSNRDAPLRVALQPNV